MRRIYRRAFSVLLLAALVLGGLGIYIGRYITKGAEWATYFSSANSGSSGEIYDRNGIMLASFDATQYLYADDSLTRTANYHVTGDYWGRTGTGVLSEFWNNSKDFSLVTGTMKSVSHELTLNIDAEADNVAYTALGSDSKGAVMVMNYKTGEVLCMVSCPTVDPLDNSEPADGAYINRCLSASFTPGSVFKLITAAAAIENISDLDYRSFYCDGVYTIAGIDITCAGTHYSQSFAEALANSCNCAFAQITVMLGQDTMVDYVRKYGFLDAHELDGIPTASGNYPTEFVGDPELAWSGIGQSTDLICPYTLLRYVAAIANNGILIEPRLVQSDDTPEATQILNASTAEKLQELMRFDVTDHYGTWNFPGLDICAKTGTAETGDGTTHAWFAGFLQDEEHPYAFVVLVENGGGGLSVAGPIANSVLQYLTTNY